MLNVNPHHILLCILLLHTSVIALVDSMDATIHSISTKECGSTKVRILLATSVVGKEKEGAGVKKFFLRFISILRGSQVGESRKVVFFLG